MREKIGALAALAAALTAQQCQTEPIEIGTQNPNESGQSFVTPTPPDELQEVSPEINKISHNLKMLESDINPEVREMSISMINEFMQLPSNNGLIADNDNRVNDPRCQAEEKMWSYIENNDPKIGDIIFGLKYTVSRNGRSWGIQLLFNKLQNGELEQYGLNPLSPEKVNWANNNGIDPMLLAISEYTKPIAAELIEIAPDLYLEAMDDPSEFDPEQMANAGITAKLLSTETGYYGENGRYYGLVNIGEFSAIQEINTDFSLFPSGKEDLEWIAQYLTQQSNNAIPFPVNKIPGSYRGDVIENYTGGAIGPQLMPITFRRLAIWYNEANKRLEYKYPPANPFDPFTMAILAHTEIAAQYYHRHSSVNSPTDVIRYSYQSRNTHEQKMLALYKWNNNPEQMNAVLNAGYDYYKLFIAPEQSLIIDINGKQVGIVTDGEVIFWRGIENPIADLVG